MTLSPQRMRWILLVVIFAAGIIVRVACFGALPPSGLYQDEAYAGYEAFSLATAGVDSDGYPNPVYFRAWGSGMNVMESYLAIPFVKLVGCTAVAIRLPQLILGLVTLPVFYLLTRKVFSEPVALVGTALLALCPWHVMLCRFALESNLAPAFYLMGLFFLVKGTEDSRFWVLSALFFGFTLYTYAIAWAVVPLTILFGGIYLIVKRKGLTGFRWPWLVAAVVLLFLLALPLILFLLVNRNVIPEIITPVLSIPRLTAMRVGDFSAANILNPQAWLTLLSVLFGFPDTTIFNNIPAFGAFYYLSVPFIIGGLIALTASVIKHARSSHLDLRALILLGFLATVIACLMTRHVDLHQSNCMHAFSLIFAAMGLVGLCQWMAAKRAVIAKVAGGALCVAYLGFAGAFCTYYFTAYDDLPEVKGIFNAGLDDALAWIQENVPSNARVAYDVQYPNILYFAEVPTREFIHTVVYPYEDEGFRYPERFGRYIYGYPDEQDPDLSCVYLCEANSDWLAFFQDHGFQVQAFESCFVAYYPS